MRIEDLRRSSNVDDHRGGGGGRRVAVSGGVAVVVIVAGLALGLSPSEIMSLLAGGDSSPRQRTSQRPPSDDKSADFVSAILGSTEDEWNALFQKAGKTYREPRLVLFRDGVDSACGFASSAVGPFYCPGDKKVYLDLSFFDDLSRRFGAPGDFAQAYVVAHEVGHHVQHQLNPRRKGNDEGANSDSVRLELQADCYAGVWASKANEHHRVLEAGDVEEAIKAATAIGDDTLQKRGRGRVVPDSFTHGTAAQRVRWLKRGLEKGTIDACDTFSASSL